MTVTLQRTPICHCRSVRHVIAGPDRRRVRTAEQAAILAGKADLAGYYGGQLMPCPTAAPTVDMVAVRAAADLRNTRAVTR